MKEMNKTKWFLLQLKWKTFQNENSTPNNCLHQKKKVSTTSTSFFSLFVFRFLQNKLFCEFSLFINSTNSNKCIKIKQWIKSFCRFYSIHFTAGENEKRQKKAYKREVKVKKKIRHKNRMKSFCIIKVTFFLSYSQYKVDIYLCYRK